MSKFYESKIIKMINIYIVKIFTETTYLWEPKKLITICDF